MSGTEATLLTRSATTGWADWIWGELWLFPDGLLRLPTDFRTSRQRARTRGQAEPMMRKTFDEAPAQLADGARHGLWFPRDEIESAHLRRGVFNSRLGVRMADGRNLKLLWLKSDRAAFDALEEVLQEWVGEKLELG